MITSNILHELPDACLFHIYYTHAIRENFPLGRAGGRGQEEDFYDETIVISGEYSQSM
jgi:hypothetical protein